MQEEGGRGRFVHYPLVRQRPLDFLLARAQVVVVEHPGTLPPGLLESLIAARRERGVRLVILAGLDSLPAEQAQFFERPSADPGTDQLSPGPWRPEIFPGCWMNPSRNAKAGVAIARAALQ